MPATPDHLMESASQALADLDYARCEALCCEALAKARDACDWVMVQRVLLPLQEARRQRRQAALDGPILLGTTTKTGSLVDHFDEIEQGCVVVTWPYTISDVKALSLAVRSMKKPIEVLFADNASDDATWRITSYTGAGLSVDMPAPRSSWVGQWIDPMTIKPPTPAHWFMQASEALGNAALARIEALPGTLAYFRALQDALSCVEDHEILHQRLSAAAKGLHEAKR